MKESQRKRNPVSGDFLEKEGNRRVVFISLALILCAQRQPWMGRPEKIGSAEVLTPVAALDRIRDQVAEVIEDLGSERNI